MRLRTHLPAAALFALLALAWTFPLVLHLGTHVPGGGAGDNLSFVWNLWWIRTAWQHHLDPFYTTYLFHPIGVNLIQHTHTAFNGAIAASFLAGLSPVAAQNVLLLLALFANGFVAYLLAYQVSGSRYAAIAAGIAFGGAAPVLIRLQGHFNLVDAWVTPLSVLMFGHAARRGTRKWWFLAGGGLGVSAYCDYYYLAYSLVLVAICLVHRWFEVRVTTARRLSRFWQRCALTLLLVDLLLMTVIAITGGFVVSLGPARVPMLRTFNLRVAFWALVGLWGLSRWRVSVTARVRPTVDAHAEMRAGSMIASGFIIVCLPLIAATLPLLLGNDYTTQHYFWRSAPPGVDVAAFVVGNPQSLFYGSLSRRAYAAIGMNPVEGVAWITLAAVVIVVAGWHRLRDVTEARRWWVVAAVFTVWSLGPHLDFFGTQPGIVLPGSLLRFVPLVSNARIPGRAVVVVVLAVAMMLALTLARLAPDWSHRRKALILVLLLLDVVNAPIPLYRLQPNAIYAVLHDQPGGGAVLELPLGLRDGFGELGHFDARTLYYQTISGKPMLGGFVARLPQRVKSWYEHEPVVAALLKLSDPGCPPDWNPDALSPQQVYEALARASVRYVVLDRAAASNGLLRYVSSFPLRRLAQDSGRELYELGKP